MFTEEGLNHKEIGDFIEISRAVVFFYLQHPQ